MKVKKQKKGISLIVLIITIIIMIILASAIIISLSNSGIIDNARKAVDLSNESGIKEALEITVSLLKQENKLNEENLKSELEKSSNEEVEVTKDIDGSYTVGVKGIYFTIEDDKIIKGKYDKWDGTKLEPTSMTDNEIHIYKASELKWVQEQVAEGNSFEGYTIYLENNLDLGARESSGDTLDEKWKTDANKATKWTPIGKTEEVGLKAKFEGNDHVIKGVYVEETTDNTGLFGCVENVVQNLSIKNSYIEGTNYVGGLVGLTTSDITNCHNINSTVVQGEGEYWVVGGVVGQIANGTVSYSSNSGEVLGKGIYADYYSCCGGVSGWAYVVEHCSNTGNITSEGMIVGGIVGYLTSNVKDCVNKGEILAYSGHAGGVVGQAYREAIIDYCKNMGSIKAGKGLWSSRPFSDCGGIVGQAPALGEVSNCYNSGIVYGEYGVAGGIVGTIPPYNYGSDCDVKYNINVGNIEGRYYVGGIVAWIRGSEGSSTIEFCYNKGNIKADHDFGSISAGAYNKTDAHTYRHLYYLSSLNLGAINGVDDIENNVTSTTKDINTFEEFKTWIAQFE